MGDKTSISWTDATWSPVTGCDRISPGCLNCYALTLSKRLKAMGSAKYQNDGDPRTSGPGFKSTVHEDSLDQPIRWKRPRRIFVCSMSDLFHEDVPDEFIARVFAVMARAGHHEYQVLTKRPQRMARLLGDSAQPLLELLDDPVEAQALYDSDWPLPAVWLGTSIESDAYTFRADHLRRTQAAVRFLSCEPLLGPLPSLDLSGIHWLICGGESGPGARRMDLAWARDLRDRCADSGVAFFFKQTGSVLARELGLDGKGEHGAPVDLAVQEWPAG